VLAERGPMRWCCLACELPWVTVVADRWYNRKTIHGKLLLLMRGV
jgi:hypothetical protein